MTSIYSLTILINIAHFVRGQTCGWNFTQPYGVQIYTRAIGAPASFEVHVKGEVLTTADRVTWQGNGMDLSVLRYGDSGVFEQLLDTPTVNASSGTGFHAMTIPAVNETDDGVQISVISGGCTVNDVSPVITLDVKCCNLTFFEPEASVTDTTCCGYNCARDFFLRSDNSTFHATCQEDATWNRAVAPASTTVETKTVANASTTVMDITTMGTSTVADDRAITGVVNATTTDSSAITDDTVMFTDTSIVTETTAVDATITVTSAVTFKDVSTIAETSTVTDTAGTNKSTATNAPTTTSDIVTESTPKIECSFDSKANATFLPERPNLSSTEFFLSWNNVSTNYIVSVDCIECSGDIQYYRTNSSEIVLTGLVPGRYYNVCVMAELCVMGLLDNRTQCERFLTNPPSVPADNVTISQKSSGVRVSWDSVESATSYGVSVFLVSLSRATLISQVISDIEDTSILLSSLSPCKSYSIDVIAFNEGGGSIPASIAINTACPSTDPGSANTFSIISTADTLSTRGVTTTASSVITSRSTVPTTTATTPSTTEYVTTADADITSTSSPSTVSEREDTTTEPAVSTIQSITSTASVATPPSTRATSTASEPTLDTNRSETPLPTSYTSLKSMSTTPVVTITTAATTIGNETTLGTPTTTQPAPASVPWWLILAIVLAVVILIACVIAIVIYYKRKGKNSP